MCMYCDNAFTNPVLQHDNDLSFIAVGKVDPDHSIYFRSGDNRPTVLLFQKLIPNVDPCVIDVGEFVMKYCPLCGRELLENMPYSNLWS